MPFVRNVTLAKVLLALTLIALGCSNSNAKPIHHYIFFGQDRERLRDAKSFFDTKQFEGAQVTYSWRQLEPGKDEYDFTLIREDLALLSSKGKRLFIELADVSFSPSRINVPRYLLNEKEFNGGADKQYRYKEGDEEHAVAQGWMARRWDPAVQARLHKLLAALGKEFDGRITGINLTETALEVGSSGLLFPKGFTFEIYRDAIVTNMRALKRAFPKSIVMQYANFMPGEWLPSNDKSYLRTVYKEARTLKIGVGGPDLLPFRRGQRDHSYPLIRESAGLIPTGIAVQDGNYAEPNPATGKRLPISELLEFARDYLKVDYIFWCTEEPYYSQDLVPFIQSHVN